MRRRSHCHVCRGIKVLSDGDAADAPEHVDVDVEPDAFQAKRRKDGEDDDAAAEAE